ASSKRAGTRSGWIETVARKFSSTETVLEPLFATARSNLPSPLRSPIATEEGPLPVPKSAFGPNDPSPASSRTETAYEPQQAVARAEQHRYRVRASVRHGQVGLAVAVELADRHGGGIAPRAEVGLRPERPVAVAEQHRDRVRIVVRRDQVGSAVAVEVADRHGD